MKVLVTGFEPFGGESINPALELLELLPDSLDGIEIKKARIPTVFGESLEVLGQAIEEVQPDIVLALGQAGGRKKLTIERLAINIDDAGIPDNSGNLPVDRPIYGDGENAYFSNLPIKRMIQAMREKNIPVDISNTAGTFVCNHLMYGILYLIDKEYPDMRGGFIHLPFLPDQVLDKNAPSMALEDMERALLEAIRVAANFHQDISQAAGKTH